MRFDRVWSMPSKNTFSIKPIKQLIEDEFDTDYHMDALEFLN